MLLFLVLIVITVLACQKLLLIREGFDNIAYENTESSVCPANLTAKLTNGITFCNDAHGLAACALIGDDETPSGIPACHTIMKEYLAEQGAQFCPPSMHNYFENALTGTSGCTAAFLTANKMAPADPSAPQCTVYNSDHDFTTIASCFNQKQLEQTKTFGTNAVKRLIPFHGTPPAYVTQISYNIPDTPLPQYCFPDQHMLKILEYLQQFDTGNLHAYYIKLAGMIRTGNWGGSCEALQKVLNKSMPAANLIYAEWL